MRAVIAAILVVSLRWFFALTIALTVLKLLNIEPIYGIVGFLLGTLFLLEVERELEK